MALSLNHNPDLNASFSAAGQRLAFTYILQVEIRAFHQSLPQPANGTRIARRPAEAAGPYGLYGSPVPVDARQRFLDVQRARPALGIPAVPIEEAERGVTGLLH